MRSRLLVPDFMPTLSAGRHRTPKSGACFMEFASYLAGERWSDHPPCTDPLLASLARGVNDALSNDDRAALVTHIPRVVGLRGDDATVGMIVALRAAAHALPIASMERQRSLAVGVVAITEVLGRRGIDPGDLIATAERALADVPDAARFAAAQIETLGLSDRGIARYGSAAMLRVAVVGAAEACTDRRSEVLTAMLVDAIGDVERLLGRGATPVAVQLADRELLSA
ncbi:hypothetical protein BH11ACT3_BH11ACT3_24610 [soil metagenome]